MSIFGVGFFGPHFPAFEVFTEKISTFGPYVGKYRPEVPRIWTFLYAVPVSDFTFVSRFSSLLSIVFSWFNKIFHLLYYCCCLFLLWTEWIHIGISNPPSGMTEAWCCLSATDPACYWLTFLQEVRIIWKLLLVCAQFYPIYWSWFYNSRPVFVCFFH